jgi:hypothetical protein
MTRIWKRGGQGPRCENFNWTKIFEFQIWRFSLAFGFQTQRTRNQYIQLQLNTVGNTINETRPACMSQEIQHIKRHELNTTVLRTNLRYKNRERQPLHEIHQLFHVRIDGFVSLLPSLQIENFVIAGGCQLLRFKAHVGIEMELGTSTNDLHQM